MSQFDDHAVSYFNAEQHYHSLRSAVGKIPQNNFLAAKESLLSFEFDLFQEQLIAFCEEIKTVETYHALLSEWCASDNCTSLKPFNELLSQESYENAISRVGYTITVVQKYREIEETLMKCDWFTELGSFLLGKNGNFHRDLENAKEEIKSGDLEEASSILTQLQKEFSRMRKYGAGIVFVAGLSSILLFLFMI